MECGVKEDNSLVGWCLSHGNFGQQLLKEWVGLSPDGRQVSLYNVTKGSAKNVQWRCSKGHEWCAAVAMRTSGQGCPVCDRERKAKSFDGSSLQDWCKINGKFGVTLASEWTGRLGSKSGVPMEAVSYGSRKTALWRCCKGHEWFAKIGDRTRDEAGCPQCNTESGRVHLGKNLKCNLAEWCRDNGDRGERVSLEWTGEFDDRQGVSLAEVAHASYKKAKWKCSKNHEWEASISSRTVQGHNCPHCYALRLAEPTLGHSLAEWCNRNRIIGRTLKKEWLGESESGEVLDMSEISYGSGKRVKWMCSEKHVWSCELKSRTLCGTGCPVCALNRNWVV